MKVGALIEKLQRLKNEHGDIIVTRHNEEWGIDFEIDHCEFRETPKSPSSWTLGVGGILSERVVLQ